MDKLSHALWLAQWALLGPAGLLGWVPVIFFVTLIVYHFRHKPAELRRTLYLVLCPLIFSVLLPLVVGALTPDAPHKPKPPEWLEVLVSVLFFVQIPILIVIVYNLRRFLIVALPLTIAELWIGLVSFFISGGFLTDSLP